MRIVKYNLTGQALVSVIIFVIIAMIITSGAIILTITNSLASNSFDQGNDALLAAESGTEDGLIKLLRDPTYTGETQSISGNSVQISVTGSNPFTIISVGRSGNFQRTIQTTVTYTNNVMNVTSWKETN